MTKRAYFDWNATAPLRKEARTALVQALALTGNASSVHGEGRAARRLVEEARIEVAALVAAEAKNVIFTSGATEANMLALTPALTVAGRKEPRARLFVSAIEHPSVLRGGRFAPDDVEELPVDADGRLDLAALARRLATSERALVSVMLANNETGVIQPIAQIADIVHRVGGVLHVDAVQAPGRIDVDIVCAWRRSAQSFRPQNRRTARRRRTHRSRRHPCCGTADQRRWPGARSACRNRKCGRHRWLWRRRRDCRKAGVASRMAALRDRLEIGIRRTNPEVVIFGDAADRLPNRRFSRFLV